MPARSRLLSRPDSPLRDPSAVSASSAVKRPWALSSCPAFDHRGARRPACYVSPCQVPGWWPGFGLAADRAQPAIRSSSSGSEEITLPISQKRGGPIYSPGRSPGGTRSRPRRDQHRRQRSSRLPAPCAHWLLALLSFLCGKTTTTFSLVLFPLRCSWTGQRPDAVPPALDATTPPLIVASSPRGLSCAFSDCGPPGGHTSSWPSRPI